MENNSLPNDYLLFIYLEKLEPGTERPWCMKEERTFNQTYCTELHDKIWFSQTILLNFISSYGYQANILKQLR